MIHYTEMPTQLPQISSFGKIQTNSKTKRGADNKVIEDSRYEVYKVAASFAIHTSKYQDEKNQQFSVPYIWTINIAGTTFFGRTIEDFIEATELLKSFYKLNEARRLRLYAYRLVAEFQTIRKYFTVVDSFSAERRKPYYVILDNGLELYDAQAMVDKSVDNIASDLGLEYIDDKSPNEKRSSVMTLDADTLKFVQCHTDIIYKLVQDELNQVGSILKLPLTNTQRVRRHINKNCLQDKPYMAKVRNLTMQYDDFLLLKRCFTGGFTFANPRFRNKVIEDVTSLDIASAYPSIITTELFPMTTFKETVISSYAEFIDFVTDYQFCCAFDVTLYNLESKRDDIFLLNEDQIHYGTGKNVQTLGGKVDSADEITISLTNVDWVIFSQLYTFDTNRFVINQFMHARAGYLPNAIVRPVLDLYNDKTVLKGDKNSERQYKEAKVKLNSIYGMLVTDEVHRDTVKFENDLWTEELYDTYEAQLLKDVESLNNYNAKKSRTTFYGWGVWVTAYARRRLFSVILKTADDFVYCDTDSVKICNYDKYKTVFANDILRQKSRIDFAIQENKSLSRIDFAPKSKIDNEYKIIGVFEIEHTYSKFKALRSKQYVGIKNNELEVTCSGIPKKALSNHLMSISKNIDEAIDNFNYELDIPANATTIKTICFVDREMTKQIIDAHGNKLTVNVKSCVYYEPRGYSLSADSEFLEQSLLFSQGQVFTPTY